MPKKRAVLIGCNYPGTNAELAGCINDVWSMKEMLMNHFGFAESDMVIMIDTDKNYLQPTGRNIKSRFADMVKKAEDGDELFIHFSGHGTQVPSDDPRETDGKDEAIVPCDMNVICDGDLRNIFMPLKGKKVKLTFVADCCHSGTILDHDEVIITGPKAGGPPPPNIDAQAIQNMLAALGAGPNREIRIGEIPVKNRALAFDQLCEFLSGLLGSIVGKGNVRQGMRDLFGDDASVRAIEYVKYQAMFNQGMQYVTDMMKGGDNMERGMNGLCGLFFNCLGGGSSADQNQNQGQAYAAEEEEEAKPQNAGAQATIQTGGEPAKTDEAPPPPPADAQAGHKPPADEQLPDEVGILITGCQDKETSADARPPGGKPHGALSNALTTTVNKHFNDNPGTPLTYRNLVIGVRQVLGKTGFAQNPCLECSTAWADGPIITYN
mmetsp:Transcript_15424/g.33435  ORF Transcript_15424/g.33435 Transcript_15424/m.33435 type:complete len:436 (-) Transcript_15424:513-1820(-)|eukprot:CAMPEP_0202908488 /NCGR_PEP_ID=MMETSP1392-20130828/46201_1 /ASSEMBLY_ACC=CAM_ASM_000868 /TAXON_ID=225041 /ORGANISM="Chlamydomonas chlamydogama, Strain SAG 11-48b" /LENGTH=435 /DNA_ID=CAMNT_0049597863 /DNA_START=37 /DNA_END=1344 /DNA_ORIENTATION=+